MPKLTYVFDDDVDIYNDECVKWAQAWRYNPEKGTMILPQQNVLPLDPSLGTDHPPVNISKVGFDCTIPLVGQVDRFAFAAATVSEPLTQPAKANVKSETDIANEMAELIRSKPRAWARFWNILQGSHIQWFIVPSDSFATSWDEWRMNAQIIYTPFQMPILFMVTGPVLTLSPLEERHEARRSAHAVRNVLVDKEHEMPQTSPEQYVEALHRADRIGF
jgi:3-polyprenyl-4-hydroxybenzoate decarboxylase